MTTFGGVVSLAILVFLFIAPVGSLIWRVYVHFAWLPARGVVKQNNRAYDSDAGPTWNPSVEFIVAGKTYVVTVSPAQWAGARPRYQVGQILDLLYNPKDPTRAIIDTWMSYIVLAVIAVSAAYFFAKAL